MLPVHVAVAVIQDAGGRVLLTRRPDSAHQGGLWEFPGGKVERGEDLPAALRREIREELGIEVSTHQPLIDITHIYPDKTVRLDVHRVLRYWGTPLGMEGQPLEWVLPEHLSHYPMPAADRPICTALKLPRRYLITGPDPAATQQFLRRLEVSLDRGVRLVQLRAPALERDAYANLASAALELCHGFGAKLLLNGASDLALELRADGVHLSGRQLAGLSSRPLPADQWVAASCHNLAELRQAMAIDADFCVLSPVQLTATHPDAAALGWEQFSRIVSASRIPVYALGGMDQTHIDQAIESGAQGIAAIRSLWAGEIQ